MMYPAGSCLIFPESFQIFLGNGIAFKFQMDPGTILPYIVKILIHLPRFQHYSLRRSDVVDHTLNSKQGHQLFTEVLSRCFQRQIFMMNGVFSCRILFFRRFVNLFRAFFHTASCSVSHVQSPVFHIIITDNPTPDNRILHFKTIISKVLLCFDSWNCFLITCIE